MSTEEYKVSIVNTIAWALVAITLIVCVTCCEMSKSPKQDANTKREAK